MVDTARIRGEARRGKRYGNLLPAALFVILLCCGACGDGQDESETTAGKGSLVPTGSEAAAGDTSAAATDTAEGLRPAAGQDRTAGRPADATPDPAAQPAQQTLASSSADGGAGQADESDDSDDATVAPVRGGGVYSLQVGSFRNPVNAEIRARSLSDAGYDAELRTVELAGRTYHRVMLNGIADRLEARRVGEELTERFGFSYLVKRSD